MKKLISLLIYYFKKIIQMLLLGLGLAKKESEHSRLLNTQLRRHFDLINFIKKTIPETNTTILDIGCGRGELAHYADTISNYQFDGIDWLPKDQVTHLTQFKTYTQIDLNCGNFPIKNESYKYIVMSDVIEHLENPALALREISRILQKDGSAFLTIPNAINIPQRLKFLLSGNSSRYKVEKPNSFGHISFFTINTLKSIAKRAELKITCLDGGGFYFDGVWILPKKKWGILFSYNIIIQLKKL